MTEMESARKRYLDIPIPAELSYQVQRAIKSVNPNREPAKKRTGRRVLTYVAAAAAVVFAVNVLLLNTSEAYAKTLEQVPVIGTIAKVFTFREYTMKDQDKETTVKIPKVEDQNGTNQKFVADVNAEIQKKCDAYTKKADQDIAEYKEAFLSTGGTKEDWEAKNIKVKVSYTIKTQNEDYVSFVVTGIEDWNGSTAETYYYNLDLKNGTYFTLQDILGDDYLTKCNQEIERQMEERMAADSDILYFTAEEGGFSTISKQTKFYLNEKGNPVVVFEKYEVAPGFMGAQEFEIQR